jgi:hypothetical protein
MLGGELRVPDDGWPLCQGDKCHHRTSPRADSGAAQTGFETPECEHNLLMNTFVLRVTAGGLMTLEQAVLPNPVILLPE